jgi:flagellar motor switch protein FliN/FliY
VSTDLDVIRKLEVPIIVQLGRKAMSLAEVMAFMPGAIIELPKRAEDELELMVNNRSIGTGVAVKVGENFGLQIEFVGDVRTRIEAMGEIRREARPLTMNEPAG